MRRPAWPPEQSERMRQRSGPDAIPLLAKPGSAVFGHGRALGQGGFADQSGGTRPERFGRAWRFGQRFGYLRGTGGKIWQIG